jgi:hypothetical protein
MLFYWESFGGLPAESVAVGRLTPIPQHRFLSLKVLGSAIIATAS